MAQEKGSQGKKEVMISEPTLQERLRAKSELLASVQAAKKIIEDLCEGAGYGVSVEIKVWDRSLR